MDYTSKQLRESRKNEIGTAKVEWRSFFDARKSFEAKPERPDLSGIHLLFNLSMDGGKAQMKYLDLNINQEEN
jgi:hypothetical protein